MNKCVVFKATTCMFTDTFGLLLWEKFFALKESQQTLELWPSKG